MTEPSASERVRAQIAQLREDGTLERVAAALQEAAGTDRRLTHAEYHDAKLDPAVRRQMNAFEQELIRAYRAGELGSPLSFPFEMGRVNHALRDAGLPTVNLRYLSETLAAHR